MGSVTGPTSRHDPVALEAPEGQIAQDAPVALNALKFQKVQASPKAPGVPKTLAAHQALPVGYSSPGGTSAARGHGDAPARGSPGCCDA